MCKRMGGHTITNLESSGRAVRLTRSEARREHPANALHLVLAILRLKLRVGAKQLGLLR